MGEAVTGNYGRHWLVVAAKRFIHVVMNACYEKNGLVREICGGGEGGVMVYPTPGKNGTRDCIIRGRHRPGVRSVSPWRERIKNESPGEHTKR